MGRDAKHHAPSLIDRIFQPGTLALLACAAGVAVLAPWLLRQLPDLKTRPEYQVAFQAIELNPPPSGVIPADLVRQIQRQRDFPEWVSTLDPALTKRLATAFREHPWIETVREVRLNYPPKIVVKVEYRRPVALIAIKAGYYPIDPEGILLPPSDFSTQDATRYPLVKNIRSVPAGPAGQPWGDPVILASARLADVLCRDWAELNLSAIVAPKPVKADMDPADLVFTLQAQGGSRVVWGRAPGSGHPGELTAVQKIGRLHKYLKEYGGFDQPRGPYEIDIRHWQEITRRPLDPRQIDAAMEERLPVR